MKALLDVENIDFLEHLFPRFKPQLSKIDFIGTISIFSFFFESEKELYDNWEVITSSIAAYYQSELDDETKEFERWNIYIIFFVRVNVSNQLKYKIENDKFSSRKIVKDNISDSINTNLISKLISEHIVNSDLDISKLDNMEQIDVNSTYSNDSKIYQLIENSNLKISGRNTDKEELENLYQQIIKEVKDEI